METTAQFCAAPIGVLSELRPTLLLEIAPHVLDDHDGGTESMMRLLCAYSYDLRDLGTLRRLPSRAEYFHLPDPTWG